MGQKLEILKYDSKYIHVIPIIVFLDVDPVQKDFSLLWIVQLAQQFDKSCFAGAVFANDGHAASDLELYTHMTQCPGIGSRIPKRNITKLYMILSIISLFSS